MRILQITTRTKGEIDIIVVGVSPTLTTNITTSDALVSILNMSQNQSLIKLHRDNTL